MRRFEWLPDLARGTRLAVRVPPPSFSISLAMGQRAAQATLVGAARCYLTATAAASRHRYIVNLCFFLASAAEEAAEQERGRLERLEAQRLRRMQVLLAEKEAAAPPQRCGFYGHDC